MNNVNSRPRYVFAVALLAAAALSACAGMSEQEKGTTAGAVIGGVAGNALCGGGLLCTGAGAVVGGAVGKEVTKPK
jgi:osmotically inducible lipoprotein OsmB